VGYDNRAIGRWVLIIIIIHLYYHQEPLLTGFRAYRPQPEIIRPHHIKMIAAGCVDGAIVPGKAVFS
jgi:hypothetical protein